MPSFCAQRTPANSTRIVFVFFTILYQLKTLLFGYRIKHNSPVDREFCQVFS
jgi:hypothetical protein